MSSPALLPPTAVRWCRSWALIYANARRRGLPGVVLVLLLLLLLLLSQRHGTTSSFVEMYTRPPMLFSTPRHVCQRFTPSLRASCPSSRAVSAAALPSSSTFGVVAGVWRHQQRRHSPQQPRRTPGVTGVAAARSQTTPRPSGFRPRRIELELRGRHQAQRTHWGSRTAQTAAAHRCGLHPWSTLAPPAPTPGVPAPAIAARIRCHPRAPASETPETLPVNHTHQATYTQC